MCPDRYDRMSAVELCFTVHVCLRVHVCVRAVSDLRSVFMTWGGGAVKVMTESPLFTVRNPHFITLMNVNGCACTPRVWQDKRRKK